MEDKCEAVVNKGCRRGLVTSSNALCRDPYRSGLRPSLAIQSDSSSTLLNIGLASEAALQGWRPLFEQNSDEREHIPTEGRAGSFMSGLIFLIEPPPVSSMFKPPYGF